MSDTSDHLPLDPDELASSYLDGELPDDQRAVVEDDPAVMALVERHRQVRDRWPSRSSRFRPSSAGDAGPRHPPRGR
jgi:anti-sigma factor RsiW